MPVAREILWQLLEGPAPADVAQFGDPSLLPEEYVAQPEQSVISQFGTDFARAVFAAEPGKWFGPIESGYGLHLVRVTEKVVPKPKDFAEVRNAFVALSLDQQQRAEEEQFYAALMKRYKVVFDESVRPLFGASEPVEDEGDEPMEQPSCWRGYANCGNSLEAVQGVDVVPPAVHVCNALGSRGPPCIPRTP